MNLKYYYNNNHVQYESCTHNRRRVGTEALS
jgi:hypothetical protein